MTRDGLEYTTRHHSSMTMKSTICLNTTIHHHHHRIAFRFRRWRFADSKRRFQGQNSAELDRPESHRNGLPFEKVDNLDSLTEEAERINLDYLQRASGPVIKIIVLRLRECASYLTTILATSHNHCFPIVCTCLLTMEELVGVAPEVEE